MNWQYRLTILCLALLGLAACNDDDLDIDELTNFAPSILTGSPANDGSVVRGDFDLRIFFADGTPSPLTSATLTLQDSGRVELFTTTKALSGTRDSVIVEGEEFNSEALEVGSYFLLVSATDAAGQTTEEEIAFTISALPFPANIERLFIAGAFNGWSADSAFLYDDYQFELVSANTWELSGVDLDGTAWKLKNDHTWDFNDWGDADCDGFMTPKSEGNGDTDCSYNGTSTIRFNDQTLAYEVIPDVTVATNLDGLFLLGTFDGVTNTLGGGDTYEFELIGDNEYDLAEITLRPGDQFKFVESEDFSGQQFGDTRVDGELDGVAEPNGPAITLSDDFEAGVYAIAFNDETLEYSIDYLRDAGFRSIGILGDGLPGGFDGPDLDLQDDDGDGVWEYEGLEITEVPDGSPEIKFRADDAWDVNWGAPDFPMGTGLQNGENILATPGVYDVTFVPATGEYNFVEAPMGFGSIGILGTALPAGFDTDYDLRDEDSEGVVDGVYEIVVGLKDGEVKFRADDAWDTNWGATDFPTGTGVMNGDNIPVTAGLYLVRFTPATGAYEFIETTVGIIGSATPTSWDSDTDLNFDASADDANVLTLEGFTLTDGEVKFRVNDEWAINWGGSDFPSGTAVFNGDNIPATAGEYTVRFNVLTQEYSFE